MMSSSFVFRAGLVGIVIAALGCGGSAKTTSTAGSGGNGGASSTGGAAGGAGGTPRGGAGGAGGRMDGGAGQSGSDAGTAGAASTGGTAGGISGLGGQAGGAGGTFVLGGVSGSGGRTGTGGVASGGAPGSGGRTGGAFASGGAMGTGGVVASGGATGSGGVSSSGGASPGTGGAATGGAATGGVATGGTGSGGAFASGGMSGGTGGVLATGGAPGTGGRGGSTGTGPAAITWDFASTTEGWVGDFCDYPPNIGTGYDLTFRWSSVPAEVGPGGGLFMSGNNHSDDLFMFIKRQVTGLAAGAEYALDVTATIDTNAPATCGGIGGSPGESVYFKIGAVSFEPTTSVDSAGRLVLNLDKGNQSQGGADMKVVGNISNNLTCPNQTYQSKTLTLTGFRVRSASDGSLWIIIGTDSGFEGITTLYYDRIAVTLTPR